jgi:hypothetical protein
MRTLIATTAAILMLVAGAGFLANAAQDRPGIVSQARVFIENRNRAEAVPVTVEDVTSERPLSVRVEGPVAIAPSGAMQARALPQAWEYRTVSGKAAEDLVAALAEPGAQGWEAAGTFVPASGSLTVLLKRPLQRQARASLGRGPSMMSP